MTDELIESKIRGLFRERNYGDLDTDDILGLFGSYIKCAEAIDDEDKETIQTIRRILKKVAFRDHKEKKWVLRD